MPEWSRWAVWDIAMPSRWRSSQTGSALCYGYLDEDLVEQVEDSAQYDPCYEFALVALETNDVFPTFSDFPAGNEQKIVLEHCGFIDRRYRSIYRHRRLREHWPRACREPAAVLEGKGIASARPRRAVSQG